MNATTHCTMKAPRLDAEIKNLCGRVALERTRPLQWQAADQLRKDAQGQLAAGAARADLVQWLQAEHAAAMRGQCKEQ